MATVREQLEAKYGKPATTTGGLTVRQQLEAKYKQPEQPKAELPKKPVGYVEPTFKASMGGASSILPNIAKFGVNIPSNIANYIGMGIVNTASNIGESLGAVSDITKSIVKAPDKIKTYKSVGEGIGESLYGMTYGLAKTAGEKLGTILGSSKLKKAEQVNQEIEDNLLRKIAETRKKGDKELELRLVSALKMLKEGKKYSEDILGKQSERKLGAEILSDIVKHPIERPLDLPLAFGTPKLSGKGKDIISDVARSTKLPQAIETGIEKTKTAVSELPQNIKSKVTGIPVVKGEQKVVNDAVEIAREKITPKYQETASAEQRMFTEGRTKQVKIAPSRREQLVGESIQPLVEQGRIRADALPFENIPEISTEVARINQGVKNLIQDKKIPFNEKSLRNKLTAVKDDASIIFTTDPTIERTYDALIDAFVNEVKNKDTLGLFLARQDFDKLPAVKKLLDGMKGATGENLRRQAVLDIRRAANEYVADLLDARTKSVALKSLIPKEAENLITKARQFNNVEDFVREGKSILQNKITDETYRAERRRIQRSLAKGETFEQAIAREGIAINLENDLRDIWQIAQSQVDPTTGKLIQDLLKQESYMIEAIGNLSEKSKGLAGSTAVSRFMDSNPTIKAVTRQAIPFSLGGIAF